MRPYPKPIKKEKEFMTAAEFRKRYGKKLSKQNKAPKKGKGSPYSQRVKKLDEWFSYAVRLLHTVDGQCRCVTCNYTAHPKQFDCGHYFSRKHKAIRWDFDNARPQCPVRNFGCNTKMGSPEVQKAFRDRLIKDGVDLEALEIRKNNLIKMSGFEMDLLIGELESMVESLLIEKSIKKWW